MARQPRFFIEGEALHIIQRGNNRDPIFAVEEDYRIEELSGRRAAPTQRGRPMRAGQTENRV